MATPLDAVAGASQVVSLAFQTFQGCIDAYKFCRQAQAIGSEGDLLRTKLQIERHRLERWAESAGLTSSTPPSGDRLNWGTINEILRQQHEILTSAEKLKKRYGLDLPEDEIKKDGREKVAGQREGSRGLERILRTLRPKLYSDDKDPPAATTTADTIAAANGPFKRIRWAAAGREHVIKVIDDLGAFNSALERLLDEADRTFLRAGIGALIREVLSRSTDLQEVEDVRRLVHTDTDETPVEASIAAAAEFKRIRLVLGVDKRDDEIQPQRTKELAATVPDLRILKEKRLSVFDNADDSETILYHAKYDGRPVLVEWRKTDATRFAVLQPYIQKLALLLSNPDPSFAILPCKGLLPSERSNRYGLVYELPSASDLQPDLEVPYKHISVHDLIASQSKVSLSSRVAVALTLAEAVLQLHTCGWLHKSIRSENVIFVASHKTDTENFPNGRPYLVGFDCSRPDTANSLTEVPDAPLYTDLYRHPNKRGPGAQGFRKRFDLYALGCVLTELAVWEQVVKVFSTCSSEAQDWSAAIAKAEADKQDIKLPSLIEVAKGKVFQKLVCHGVGQTYWEAIQLCLKDGADLSDDEELSLENQRAIVDKLRQCKI